MEFEFRLEERIELLCLVSLTKLLSFLGRSFETIFPLSVDIAGFVCLRIIDFTFDFMHLVDSTAWLTASFACF